MNEGDTKMNTRTKEITLIGLMTAVLCIAGPISLPLPFSPVPVTLGFLAIYFAAYLLGMKRAVVCCIVYLLLGFVGLPVFSGFTSGPGKLMGPTGGYMVGYIFLALISGFFVDKWNGQIVWSFIGMVLGTAVCYSFGTLWLAYQLYHGSGGSQGFGASLAVAFAAGVLPFIVGDLVKMAVCLAIGSQVRVRVRKAALN